MSESVSQGIPFLELDETNHLKLYKCNDITFTALKRAGYNCLKSPKKPDQLVAIGNKEKKVIIAIEDKDDSSKMGDAVQQIKDNYLDNLPDTNYFIARAGNQVKLLYRLNGKLLIEVNTLKMGRQVSCFGAKMITNENQEAIENLKLLCTQVLSGKKPVETSHELDIVSLVEYYNPLEKKNVIKNLWQKIFVCTGEQAHNCLNTFVELLVYKGISDAEILPREYRLSSLMKDKNENSLTTYINSVRPYINNTLFPCMPNQPGIINMDLFAFTGQETTFKSVLKELDIFGNLAQQQLDPDFKRKVLETFLGSSNREGKIKNGQHLTPRNIVQSIWRMANPEENRVISDPACGVGGFILEGLNFPYDFNYLNYKGIGIDKSKEMITLAKANMVLHLLDKIAQSPTMLPQINQVIHSTFIYTDRNGTGTLSELVENPENGEFSVRYKADYVFANVPFFSSGVTEIDNSLEELGGLDKFYLGTGLGIQSRFLKYIVEQIQDTDPGIAFVIVPDGILKNVNASIRKLLKEKADVLGIVSFPIGTFQNNNWKTSLIIFQKKTALNQYAKVMLYKVDSIGVSLDQYRAPIEENDLITMEIAWKQRLSGETSDPKCRFISRETFNKADKWIDLFDEFENNIDNTVSFSESIDILAEITHEIKEDIFDTNKLLGNIFTLENAISISLEDEEYFSVYAPAFKPTITYAKHNIGKYPLYSSQISGPVEYMYSASNKPLLFENEENEEQKVLISWNIKGDAAKDVRLHKEPFYGTENRGIIEVKNSELLIEYVQIYLKENLVSMGKFCRANEAHVGKVRSIDIKVPVDVNGKIDIKKQQEIVDAYNQIIAFKDRMQEKIDMMIESLKIINVMK